MATILITMSRGGTARNLLHTDFYKILKDSGNKIVILTPAYKDERFLSEFSHHNVFFENLVELDNWDFISRIIVGFNKGLVYNNSIAMRDRYGIYNPREGSYFKYIVKKIIFLPLSKLVFLKRFFRWLDQALVKDKFYIDIFDKYKPGLVFSTSSMEDADVYVLKQAKSRDIKTIGMAKTWDNTSKMLFRVKTDKFIVWSDYTKNEVLKYQDYKEKDIIMCGIPQFDFYKKPEYLITKEEFCNRINLPQDKKMIVFCSEGKVARYDGDIAEMVSGLINNKKLIKDSILFIRPHFMYKDDEKKFDKIKNNENVFIDTNYNHSHGFKDRWDYSKEQIKHFTSLMRYADIVITSASTISLDAIAFDKPVINIAFDGYNKVSYAESIAHWYESEYYGRVVEKGGVWMVDNEKELLNSINSYLENPNLLSRGRDATRNYFCYKVDGLSSNRIADTILSYLNK